MNAVAPNKVAEAKQFLKDNEDALKESKRRERTVSTLYTSSEDSKLSRHERVAGAAEDEFLSSLRGMVDECDDREKLHRAVAGILEGAVRDAASRYGFSKDTVFRVRLIIASDGIEAGTETLLKYVARRQNVAVMQVEKKAA